MIRLSVDKLHNQPPLFAFTHMSIPDRWASAFALSINITQTTNDMLPRTDVFSKRTWKYLGWITEGNCQFIPTIHGTMARVWNDLCHANKKATHPRAFWFPVCALCDLLSHGTAGYFVQAHRESDRERYFRGEHG